MLQKTNVNDEPTAEVMIKKVDSCTEVPNEE